MSKGNGLSACENAVWMLNHCPVNASSLLLSILTYDVEAEGISGYITFPAQPFFM